MSRPRHEQLYVDVIERVLGGIQVTTGNEPRSSAEDNEVTPHPFVGGVARSSVEVSYRGMDADNATPENHPSRKRK
jgi:hypothetical protein